MSKQVDLHDIANISVANVISNFQTSAKDLAVILNKSLDEIEFTRQHSRNTKMQLKRELRKTTKMIPYLASIDTEANHIFLEASKRLRKQLDQKVEFIPYTQDLIRQLFDAMEYITMQSFASKERVNTFMMAKQATEGTDLQWGTVVPPMAMKIAKKWMEDSEEEGD